MSESTNSAYTIATVNTKGGVGKTTITVNIGALCADLGQRALLIDCDPQGSLTKYFLLSALAPNGLGYALSRRRVDGSCISVTAVACLDFVHHDLGMPAARGLMRDIGIDSADLLLVVRARLAAKEIEPLLKLLRRYEDGVPNSRQQVRLKSTKQTA